MKRREFLQDAGLAAGLLMLQNALQPLEALAGIEKGYCHILLLSDLHLPWRDKKFPTHDEQQRIWAAKKQMLAAINSWNDVDEAAVLGDLASRYGWEEEFAWVDSYLEGLRMPWYAIAGNHDYAYVNKANEPGKLKRGTYAEKQAKLLAFTRRYHLPGVYYARSIGKYRLLYLAPDACSDWNVELSPKQLAWLEREISAYSQAPILFFCHAPLMGTLRNYRKTINTPDTTAQPADKLSAILAKCPKGSLWISGHTHTPASNDSFADDRINRFNENLVNIHNPTIDSRHICTNSLYLYPDKIVVRTYDHAKGTWLDKLERVYRA